MIYRCIYESDMSHKINGIYKINNKGYIRLRERPDECIMTKIEGFREVYDKSKDKLRENEFLIIHYKAKIYFHPSQIGKQISITYWGTGCVVELMDMERK